MAECLLSETIIRQWGFDIISAERSIQQLKLRIHNSAANAHHKVGQMVVLQSVTIELQFVMPNCGQMGSYFPRKLSEFLNIIGVFSVKPNRLNRF